MMRRCSRSVTKFGPPPSLSLSLSLSFSSTLTRGLVRGCEREWTASSPSSPAGRRVFSSSVRERDPHTDQRAAAFPQPGRTHARGVETEGGCVVGRRCQCERSIPPTGCTRSYRSTLSSREGLDFISNTGKLDLQTLMFNVLESVFVCIC